MEIIIALFFVFVGQWIAVVIHEAGHIIAAKIIGMKIVGISLGSGPNIVKVKASTGNNYINIHAIPNGGHTECDGEDKYFNLPSIMLFVAAGITMNMVAASALLVYAMQLDAGWLASMLVTASVMNSLAVVMNIIPIGGLDGMYLMEILYAMRTGDKSVLDIASEEQ